MGIGAGGGGLSCEGCSPANLENRDEIRIAQQSALAATLDISRLFRSFALLRKARQIPNLPLIFHRDVEVHAGGQ